MAVAYVMALLLAAATFYCGYQFFYRSVSAAAILGHFTAADISGAGGYQAMDLAGD